MSIWDAFGKGRYKGFSREAGQLLDKAVELAGGLGCKKADTGHLLWAMLQSDGGPAARFLAGKNISELEETSTNFIVWRKRKTRKSNELRWKYCTNYMKA